MPRAVTRGLALLGLGALASHVVLGQESPATPAGRDTSSAQSAARLPPGNSFDPGFDTEPTPEPSASDTLPSTDEPLQGEGAAFLAKATRAALVATLDVEITLLPPLRVPRAGAAELEHLDGDLSRRPIAPISVRVRAAGAPPSAHFSLVASPDRLATLEDGSAVVLHIDGLPGASASLPWKVAPLLPTAVAPNAFSMGARWAIDDRIDAPLLDTIAWHAQADLATGAAPERGTTIIRRSLRVTARWDRPEDLSFGLTQGVQVGGGNLYDHYATTVAASLFETAPSPLLHWSTYIELSGEHLALGNLAQNLGAVVNAGAAFQATSSTDFQVSVSHGLAPTATLQSNVGLSMHF